MSQQWQYKYQMYKHLQIHAQEIYAEAIKASETIGITPEMRNNIGLTGAVSGCHGLLSQTVSKAMHEAARKVIHNSVLDEKIREIIKNHYGDGYDAALVNTCEGALSLTFDVLCMPPLTGKGDNYRGRYIAPLERHIHHQGAYGRPFPPKYKEYMAERGEAAGEYGFSGKRAYNLETVFVRMSKASYDCHGIKYTPVPNLIHVDGKKTVDQITEVADRHSAFLVGFASLAYDTPGYGYGDKTKEGAPVIQSGIAKLAETYDVPYILDNAWGVPIIGADIRQIGADIIVYSMDKAVGGPTSGLIIGKEEPMVAIRRALGISGSRYGTLSSHGKAAFVTIDPGKEALVGAIAALKTLKEQPQIALNALDDLYQIVVEEFRRLPDPLQAGWNFYKSVNSLVVELNYFDTWNKEGCGIPVFSIEDMYAGSQIIQVAMSKMGIIPTIAYDGNIMISNGLGNLDEDGNLLEDPTRLAVRALFKIIEIISRHAGLLE
ncbi:MAG: hypothetical protein R6U57_03655 [Anaerolineales bacterium]